MPFLRVNGVPVRVARRSYSDAPEDIGSVARAYGGRLRKSRHARKRVVSFDLPAMSPAAAVAWEGLLTGAGERWSFDSHLFGSKGTGPTSSTGATSDATRARFGAKSLRLVATTGTITYANSGNTVAGASYLFWHWNGATWDAWAYVAPDGVTFARYKNWVATGTTPSGLTVTPSAISIILAAGGADVWVDDLVVLPYAVVATWITVDLFPSSSVAFSDLFEVRLEGDAVAEATSRTVIGRVSAVDFERGNAGTGMQSALRQLAVTLEEA